MISSYVHKMLHGPFFSGLDAPLIGQYERGQGVLAFITGQNACGKSLVRKMLSTYYHDDKIEYLHISQEGRSCSSGLQRAMIYGDEGEDSTGYNSVKMTLKALTSSKNRTQRHAIFLDEPDIGLSDEYAVSLGMRIAEYCSNPNPLLEGFWVVTHNKKLIQPVAKPHHLRLGDCKTLKEWMEESIIPADLEDLLRRGKVTHYKVQTTLSNVRKNRKYEE